MEKLRGINKYSYVFQNMYMYLKLSNAHKTKLVLGFTTLNILYVSNRSKPNTIVFVLLYCTICLLPALANLKLPSCIREVLFSLM